MLSRFPLPASLEAPLAEILVLLPSTSPDSAQAIRPELAALKAGKKGLTAAFLAVGILGALDYTARRAAEGGVGADALNKIAYLTGGSANGSRLMDAALNTASAIDALDETQLDAARAIIAARLNEVDGDVVATDAILSVGEAMTARQEDLQGFKFASPASAGSTLALSAGARAKARAGATARVKAFLSEHHAARPPVVTLSSWVFGRG